MKLPQDEILVLFALVILWLICIPVFAHYQAMSYFVGCGGVLAGMYGAFIAHEAAKVAKSGRGQDDE